MAIPASPSSGTSDISPLRSIVFVELVTTTLSITTISTLSEFVPEFLVIALALALTVTYLSSIISLILLIMTDRTEDRKAMTAHFLISATLSFLLCFSKLIERGGFKESTPEDFVLCVIMVIWTITRGMVSAIWMRGGLKALKREANGGTGKSLACTVRRQEEIERWLGVGDHDLVSADREVEAWKCKDFVVR